MKKYVVYYQWDVLEEGSKHCNHYFEEFDTIEEAVKRFNELGTDIKYILSPVKWKTEITDITNL